MSASRLSSAASTDLNFVRGVAAVLVLLSHWRLLFFRSYLELSHSGLGAKLFYFVTSLGHPAVMVFFAMSGYLVGGSVVRSIRGGRWSWKGYLLDRVTRLYTVLVPALIAGVLIDVLGIAAFGSHGVYGGGGQFEMILPNPVQNHLSLSGFFGCLAFLQTIAVPVLGSNGPLWSLANEFWYYLAFPFFALAILVHRPIGQRIAVAALGGLILLATGPSIAVLFVVWLLGAALAVVQLPQELGSAPVRFLALAAWLGLVVLQHTDRLGGLLLSDVLLGLVSGLVVASIVAGGDRNVAPAYRRVSDRLAEVSFTGYLFHLPLLVCFAARCVHGQRWDLTPLRLFEGGLVLIPTAVYVVAAWWLFERNMPRVRAWAKARLEPPLPSRAVVSVRIEPRQAPLPFVLQIDESLTQAFDREEIAA